MLIETQRIYPDGNEQHRLIYFSDSVLSHTPLPECFTFPFYYEPHPLSVIAATELQQYLEAHTSLDHNFGLAEEPGAMPIGKMFGVLVVADAGGRVGYLSAFSGKLAGTNDHPRFVPPVFDMLAENSFFLKEQEVISAVNTQLEAILADGQYIQLKQDLEVFNKRSVQEIAACKELIKSNKDHRKTQRDEQRAQMNEHDFALLDEELVKQSLADKRQLKAITDYWKEKLEQLHTSLDPLEVRIEALKNERKERSGALQAQLFQQYSFLNKDGKSKSLQDIFSPTPFGRPPSAAGECATPKLLQYAFAHGYKPLAMAEFWWGAAPKSEIRKHKQYYPACTGKCKPILAHMLEGIPLDENPFLQATEEGCELNIIFEDNYFLVVNKPAGLRSVPGVNIADSVYTRLKTTLGNIEPLIVHRLDMGTSGLLVVAKTPQVHKHIQRQFLERGVRKRYTALLTKVISGEEGEIDLPLIPDLFNRPMQLVCFKNGKKSITRWKVMERTETTTRVHFWPLTGRTHQLRMHAAHELGLNAPIIGDDLYGTPDVRLYLHAAQLSFIHPRTKELVSFEVAEDF